MAWTGTTLSELMRLRDNLLTQTNPLSTVFSSSSGQTKHVYHAASPLTAIAVDRLFIQHFSSFLKDIPYCSRCCEENKTKIISTSSSWKTAEHQIRLPSDNLKCAASHTSRTNSSLAKLLLVFLRGILLQTITATKLSCTHPTPPRTTPHNHSAEANLPFQHGAVEAEFSSQVMMKSKQVQ